MSMKTSALDVVTGDKMEVMRSLRSVSLTVCVCVRVCVCLSQYDNSESSGRIWTNFFRTHTCWIIKDYRSKLWIQSILDTD